MLRYTHTAQKVSKDPADNQLIFIDRDGVINVDLIGDYIKSWAEFRFEEGAVDALKLLSDSGYQIIIISNQAGVGDSIFPESGLKEVHSHMIKALEKDGVKVRAAYYCLHGKDEGCTCRKPELGLFEEAVRGIPFLKNKTYFIGDKKTDIEAGKRFGIKTAFVRTGHGKADESKLTPDCNPDIRADNFFDAVKKILHEH